MKKSLPRVFNSLHLFFLFSDFEIGDDPFIQKEYEGEAKQLTLWQMDLMQEGRAIFEIDSTEILMLEGYAESNTKAGAAERGILEFAYGYHFCNCLPADSTGIKSSAVAFDKSEPDNGLQVVVKPNPADAWVAFNFKVPSYVQEAVIKITDVEGRTIYSFIIDTTEGQKIWNTRNIEPGIYFYTLRAGNFSKSEKLIIK